MYYLFFFVAHPPRIDDLGRRFVAPLSPGWRVTALPWRPVTAAGDARVYLKLRQRRNRDLTLTRTHTHTNEGPSYIREKEQ